VKDITFKSLACGLFFSFTLSSFGACNRVSLFKSKSGAKPGFITAVVRGERDVERLRQDLAILRGLADFEHQIILFSIFRNYYHELEKAGPVNPELLNQLSATEKAIKQDIYEEHVRLFQKQNAGRLPSKAEQERLRRIVERDFSEIAFGTPLDRQKEKLIDMEDLYVHGSKDELLREGRRVVLDWAYEQVSAQQQLIQRKRSRLKRLGRMLATAATAVALIAGTRYLWTRDIHTSLGKKIETDPQKALQHLARDHAAIAVRDYLGFKKIKNPGDMTHEHFTEFPTIVENAVTRWKETAKRHGIEEDSLEWKLSGSDVKFAIDEGQRFAFTQKQMEHYRKEQEKKREDGGGWFK